MLCWVISLSESCASCIKKLVGERTHASGSVASCSRISHGAEHTQITFSQIDSCIYNCLGTCEIDRRRWYRPHPKGTRGMRRRVGHFIPFRHCTTVVLARWLALSRSLPSPSLLLPDCKDVPERQFPRPSFSSFSSSLALPSSMLEVTRMERHGGIAMRWTDTRRKEGRREGRRASERARLNRIWISFNTTKAAQRKTTRKARQTDETAGCDVRYLRLAERFHGLWSAAMPVPCAKMRTHQYQYLKNYNFNVSAIAGNLQSQKAMSPKCK